MTCELEASTPVLLFPICPLRGERNPNGLLGQEDDILKLVSCWRRTQIVNRTASQESPIFERRYSGSQTLFDFDSQPEDLLLRQERTVKILQSLDIP